MTEGPVARFGHVLGWTGNGIAALIVMAGAGLIGLEAKGVWLLRKAPVAYSVELPTGRVYDTLSSNPQATEHEAFDAAQALDAGRPVPGGWTVHAAGDLEGDELKKWKDLIRRSTPAARDIAMVDAWKNVALVGLVSFVLAALSYLVGRALRYIFAGPSR